MLRRMLDLLRIEVMLWSARIPISWKIRFALTRLSSLPLRGEVYWLGGKFSSDNRLGLLLLPGYLREVSTLLNSLALEPHHRLNVLDVGANAGQFAVTVLALDPAAQIISVEPNPVVEPHLRRNLERFAPRARVVNRAIGPERKQSQLFYVPGKSAQGSLVQSNASLGLLSDQEPIAVSIDEAPMTQGELAEIAPWGSELDLLKLDVEGYEATALLGLATCEPTHVWMEVIGTRVGGLSIDAAIRLLDETWNVRTRVVAHDGDNVLFSLD